MCDQCRRPRSIRQLAKSASHLYSSAWHRRRSTGTSCTFLAVLDAGSLTGGARRSARQPTLSRHVAELEAQLGAPPVRAHRARRRADRGGARDRRRRARDGGRRRRARPRSAAGATRRPSTVRVTTSDVAATWLLRRCSRRCRATPGIELELVASNALTNLLRREADIAVRMVQPAQASLVARKINDIAIVAAAHERYLARARDAAQRRRSAAAPASSASTTTPRSCAASLR